MRRAMVIFSDQHEVAAKVQSMYQSMLGDVFDFKVINHEQAAHGLKTRFDALILDSAMATSFKYPESYLFKTGLRLVPFDEDDFQEIIKHINGIKNGQTTWEFGHLYQQQV